MRSCLWKNADADLCQIALVAAALDSSLGAQHSLFHVPTRPFFRFSIGRGRILSFRRVDAVGGVSGCAFDDVASRRGRILILAALALAAYVELYGMWLSARF